MNKKQKKDLIKIITAAILYIIAELAEHFSPLGIGDKNAGSIAEQIAGGGYIIALLFFVSYVIVGYGPVSKAVRNILRGQVFDENFLMTVATVGALALRQWDEAVAVMLFYSVGELFEEIAVDRSRRSITELMDIRPDYANRITEKGEETVDPYDVVTGDIILVKPGEKVPLDGIVTEGSSTLDTSALTGESMPRDIETGMEITSGFINLSGVLKIRVTSTFDESTVSKVLDLVENSGSKKAHVEKFITRFARYYTPAVVFSAMALAIIPPLFFSQSWSDWIYRALLFLVVSCPCALVISVPLAFFGGVGAASKAGVLVKGSNYLEALSKIDIAIFDKTGTLTTGSFQVSKVVPAIGESKSYEDSMSSESSVSDEMTEECKKLLRIAAHAEAYSSHPISLSIRQAWGHTVDESIVKDVTELSGKGLKAVIEGKTYYVGNARLMNETGIRADEIAVSGRGTSAAGQSEAGTIIYIAARVSAGADMADEISSDIISDQKSSDKNRAQYLGYIVLSDAVKPDAAKAIDMLKDEGVHRTVMLTGDTDSIAKSVAEKLGVDEYHSELLPQDKVELAEKLIDSAKGKVIFTGDGINDAPVLARADVGIAMGGAGSQAAIEAADIVIMDDSLSKIPVVMNIARRTQRIAKQNVVFALSVKGLVLILGALGIANMWMAVFADVGVAVIAIMNSMRMLASNRSCTEDTF